MKAEKQNYFLLRTIFAAITSGLLLFLIFCAHAAEEKNQANSTACSPVKNSNASRGGSAILGSLLVGCIYLLSRSSEQKNTHLDQTATTSQTRDPKSKAQK